MTIPPRPLSLVLQAAVTGERGQVFVLDMGEPVRIADLAGDMICLSRHSLEEIPLVYTGLRPGKKLYEEFLADADATLPTAFKHVRCARGPAFRVAEQNTAFSRTISPHATRVPRQP